LTWLSDDVNIPFPNIVKSGTTTGSFVDKLIDPFANFSGIQIGDIVRNVTYDYVAYVVGIENNTTLLLSSNIFGDGEDYVIYQGQNYGCYIYVPSTDYSVGAQKLVVETIGGDIVTFVNPPAGVLPVQVFKVTTATDVPKLIALW
jgi:hypothetical protein